MATTVARANGVSDSHHSSIAVSISRTRPHHRSATGCTNCDACRRTVTCRTVTCHTGICRTSTSAVAGALGQKLTGRHLFIWIVRGEDVSCCRTAACLVIGRIHDHRGTAIRIAGYSRRFAASVRRRAGGGAGDHRRFPAVVGDPGDDSGVSRGHGRDGHGGRGADAWGCVRRPGRGGTRSARGARRVAAGVPTRGGQRAVRGDVLHARRRHDSR